MEVSIPEVDDFHHHFRDGEVLKDTVRHASRMFRRAVSYRTQQYQYQVVYAVGYKRPFASTAVREAQRPVSYCA